MFAKKLPGVASLIQFILKREVQGAVSLLTNTQKEEGDGKSEEDEEDDGPMPIPEHGLTKEEIEAIIDELRENEQDAENGRVFAYSYISDSKMENHSTLLAQMYESYDQIRELDNGSSSSSSSSNDRKPSHEEVVHGVYRAFLHSNALNPTMFPSLRKFETEVLDMTAWMLHGDGRVVGALTSGGTESVLMAVKAYRQRSRKLRPSISRPNIVAPVTIHPCFEKGGHFFDVEVRHCKVDENFRADVEDMRRLIDSNTILLVGSAPQYAHGVVDPIEEIAALALEKQLPCHVDACFGGYMLPWLEKLGQDIPLFDFRVPGVTSISADTHKYGYTSKGCSAILFRDEELRSHMYFAYANWPGGLFGSPSMSGSRPGGLLASAWTSMMHMGVEGYMENARKALETTQRIVQGVNEEVDGLRILTMPHMTSLAIVAENPSDLNILVVADVLEHNFKWRIERQQYPDSLHFSIFPYHHDHGVAEKLLEDLKETVRLIKEEPDSLDSALDGGSAAMYGMVASIPDKSLVDDFIINFLGEVYKNK
jgi:sphinganine-1-phosphate aldolase